MVGLINLPGYQPSPLMDFGQINQALQSRQQQQARADQMAMQERQQAEQARQFNAGNLLAQRSADRADAREPLELQQLKSSIAEAARRGAQDRELFPMIKQAKELELRLTQAKAEGKDTETMLLKSLGLGGGPEPAQPQPQQAPMPSAQPNVRPQSYNGGGAAPMQPMPVADAGGPAAGQGDANLILAQNAPAPQPAPQPAQQPAGQPSARDVMGSMTPSQKAQFGLSMIGKGEAAKVLGEAASKQELDKSTLSKANEQELKAVNSVGRLKQIAAGYKDEWLTWEGQFKQYGAALLDKSGLLRSKLSPQQVQSLDEYSTFMRDAYENLTQGIQDATGAAMGVEEAKRIGKGLPNPETDSPTQFKAKLMGSLKAHELSVQRTQFLRQNGFKGNGDAAAERLPIGRFDGLLKDSRGLYQKLKTENPNADDGAIRDSVRQIIIRKYGINA